MRGSYHTKIPSIPNYPLKSLLPEIKDKVTPIQPFYLTRSMVMVVEGEVPWWKHSVQVSKLDDQDIIITLIYLKDRKRLLNYWNSSPTLQRMFLAELLSDCLYGEVVAICSGVIAVGKAGKKDEELVSWIQTSVIWPVVRDMVELAAYQELWDQAKTITESQKKPLAR